MSHFNEAILQIYLSCLLRFSFTTLLYWILIRRFSSLNFIVLPTIISVFISYITYFIVLSSHFVCPFIYSSLPCIFIFIYLTYCISLFLDFSYFSLHLFYSFFTPIFVSLWFLLFYIHLRKHNYSFAYMYIYLCIHMFTYIQSHTFTQTLTWT